MALAEALRVEVVYCPAPGQIDSTHLVIKAGSTVADALQASGVISRHGISLPAVDVGVWCKSAALDTALRDHDRVELYRPLVVDPKEARRQRYVGKNRGKSRSAKLSGNLKK
jgi:putative ubiquitin-RnfH superfamily antitoxin RatB of RatAB toxin-antitoxin module